MRLDAAELLPSSAMTLLRKKISMVGVPAVGKTSLVSQFVHSLFSERYHSTVGVKVDRKEIEVGEQTVSMMLWDIEGGETEDRLSNDYMKGSAGLVFVADGTRPDTVSSILGLAEHARSICGPVPAVIALNKSDLSAEWNVDKRELKAFKKAKMHYETTSAKSGDGVEAVFRWIAEAVATT